MGPEGQERLLQVHKQQKEDWDNRGPTDEWGRDLVTKNVEKTKVLEAFFASVFTSKTCLQQSQVPGRPEEESGARKTCPAWRRIKLRNIYTNWTYINL